MKRKKVPDRDARRKELPAGQPEILAQMKVLNRRNTLCISRFKTAQLGQKIR